MIIITSRTGASCVLVLIALVSAFAAAKTAGSGRHQLVSAFAETRVNETRAEEENSRLERLIDSFQELLLIEDGALLRTGIRLTTLKGLLFSTLEEQYALIGDGNLEIDVIAGRIKQAKVQRDNVRELIKRYEQNSRELCSKAKLWEARAQAAVAKAGDLRKSAKEKEAEIAVLRADLEKLVELAQRQRTDLASLNSELAALQSKANRTAQKAADTEAESETEKARVRDLREWKDALLKELKRVIKVESAAEAAYHG
jgi:chromosome segregation ATPase